MAQDLTLLFFHRLRADKWLPIHFNRWAAGAGLKGAIEIAVPMTVAGIVFFRVKGLMEQVSMGRPLTTLEVFVLLGAMTAVISWAVSRQMFWSGRRKPIVIAIMATVFMWCSVWIGQTTYPWFWRHPVRMFLKVYLFRLMVFGKVGQVLLVRWAR